jgi:hypothetical protein
MPLESMSELSTVARAELAIANCDGRVVAAERWSEHIPPGRSDDTGKFDDGPTPGPPPVSITDLYQFVSGPEKLLLLAGVICALGAGLFMPMMTIVFGNTFEKLGVVETIPDRSVMGAPLRSRRPSTTKI